MKRWQVIFGILLVVMGIFALVDAIFDVNLWRFLSPLLLIGLGVLLILRPRMAGSDVQVQMPMLGDIRKKGAWEATRHEFWWLVGSTYLDFTDVIFPEGEAVINIFGLVSDVKIILPDDVGLHVGATAFVTEYKSPEGRREQFLSTLDHQTQNYLTADKRVRLHTLGFVSEIKVKRPLI